MKLIRIFMALASGVTVGRMMFKKKLYRDLNDKTVLVTGGSRGLGLLLAREYGRAGARVAICAREADELEAAAAELRTWGVHRVLTVVCDVADPDDVAKMIVTVQDEWESIDILVNNAGIIQTGPLESQTVDDFKNAMEVMLYGGLHTTMTLLPLMQERDEGHIVNITSVGGKVAVPHLLPYGTAKFAAVGFSEGLAAELYGTGVHVTTVVPGLMRTGSYLNAFFKGDHEEEFTWFGLADNLPFLSIDAERAAAKIVEATQRGDTEIILTFPAKLLVRIHGLFPALTVRTLALINRIMLPKGRETDMVRGMEIQESMDSSLFNMLTAWGRSAARRFNQYDEEHHNGHRTPQNATEGD
jgi:short-subunit dehydrogenase